MAMITLTLRLLSWYSLRSGTMFSASASVDTAKLTGVLILSPT